MKTGTREMTRSNKARSNVSLEYILGTVLSVSWALVIWAVAIVKLVHSGIGNYIIHYTNWSWTISGVFFTIDAIASIFVLRKVLVTNITYLFWFANGTAWIVFWLMFVVLRDNPDLILNESKGYGGKYALGFVFNMERLFHVIPAFTIVFYAFLRREFIRGSVGKYFIKTRNTTWIMVLYGLIAMGSSVLFAGLYFVLLDVEFVYGVTVTPWILVGVTLVAAFIFNVLPLLVFVTQARRYRRNRQTIL